MNSLLVTSKRDGASFLRSTIPALTVKLQKMMEPTDQISYPTGGNIGKLVEKPALSDRDFRSFLDNVGELVRYESIRYLPRFFDQVGHQTTYAYIGNKHFTTNQPKL